LTWPPRWLGRVGWFALIWTASVLALAAAALVFRALMNAAGLTG
jgi:hypothetical protein